ncbi:MAG: ABC transporter ATP-binding protein [Chloroflexi bacterium]|nr:ABC transporter ATP-binding protein [Chloroflexota bacterium]
MAKIVISVENLTKSYQLGVIDSRTLAKSLNRRWARWRGKPDPYLKIGQEDLSTRRGEMILALDDVSFTVRQGEALGIIGGNGAGKSTLLKILSQVTAPTSGRIRVKGRVGSLLEVGTGFHPELTGRENMYLNGAILGMTRAEVDRKFDEIVDFSGVEQFIDTPVKRYSSGMKVRLGFAVAAHLDPEILIVDEVLAVGDAEFQKKCLGKMGAVAGEGRTVLFVSHNMGAITKLCTEAILLHEGNISYFGQTDDVVRRYSLQEKTSGEIIRSDVKKSEVTIKRAALLKEESVCTLFKNSESAVLFIQCNVIDPIEGMQISFELSDQADLVLYTSTNLDYEGKKEVLSPGDYSFRVPLNLQYFRSGRYTISIAANVPNERWLDVVEEKLVFDVLDDSSPIVKLNQGRRGVFLPTVKWESRIVK